MHRLGGLLHFLFQIAQDGFPIAVEELNQSADIFVVGIAGNFVGAGGGALVDRVEETRAEEFFSRIRFEDLQVTGAEFEGALEVLNGFFELIDARERAVKLDAVGAGNAGDVNAGIIVIERDHQVWVSFVIDEADVEARLDVFDQAILGQQCFDFAFGLKGFKIHHVLDHLGLETFELGAGLEIRANPVAQGGRFANVDHAAFVVLHQVDTG